MFKTIKRYQATKRHLWFLKKQKFNLLEKPLNNSFFDSFSNVFIISPHMDDEVFGSFQLIQQLIKMKKNIKIIFCVSKENGKETIRRIKESQQLFPKIEKIYLGFDDLMLEHVMDILKEKLLNILKSYNSLYVYPEYVKENHKDHNAVNQVMTTICEIQQHKCILKTELIVPIKRSYYLKLEDFNKKISAIQNYQSQKHHANYKQIEIFLASSGGKSEFREHYAK